MADKPAVVDQKEAENQPKIHSGPPFDPLPDHTELPEEDGAIVQNFHEHPQSVLLTETLWPILQQLHPDGQFAIGQDSGIYWRITEPREKGAIAPDWFYVPDVPPTLHGEIRRSYVMWQEYVAPFIIMEFVSATDGGERDRTPSEGKFWVYEKVIRPAFYVIYDAAKGLVDVYHLVEGRFQPLPPNERKHFPIPQLGIEIGIWRGRYKNMQLPWLRVWDAQGNLLPTPEERAEQEAQRAEQEAQRAAQEAQRAERLAAKLRELGIDPDEVTGA
ncbi:MAG: Uma2 family endonuclease [Caldilineaceae bacterium]